MASKDKNHVIDTHNRVTMETLEKIIKTNVQTIIDDPKMSSMIPPVLIHSAPGVGKSSLIRQICEDLGIQFIDVRLAEMESLDIRGLPSVNKEKGQMEWNAPDFWPRDPNAKGIIFFDELTSAQKDCQVASYEIILDRKIGEFYKVPDGFYIVAAGNRVEDRAVATTMSSALANRFLHVEVEADVEDWVKWAMTSDIHPSVTGFIQYKPNLLFNMKDENLERGWPSPRSWEKVSRMVNLYSKDVDLLRKIVYGLVGNMAGVEFMEFHKINANFDSVLEMMLGQREIKIPEELDKKYALCSAVSYLLWRGRDAKDQDKRINGFFDICIELPSDFSSMLMISAYNGIDKNMKKFYSDTIVKHPKYKEWVKKHGNAVRKRIILN